MSPHKKIEALCELLRERKSVVVSVDKGRAIVAAIVETCGRCHTTIGGRYTWRVMVEGMGELRVSVAADPAIAQREGVYVALSACEVSAADAPAPAPAPVVAPERAELLEQLRAAQQEIMSRGAAGAALKVDRAARASTRQPSRLEVEQMRAVAAFSPTRRPAEGSTAWRRLRAS